VLERLDGSVRRATRVPNTAAPSDPLDAALRIAAAFEDAGISYALGGALAYGLWAVPRATVDVDVNVFVGDDALPAVFQTLTSLGVRIDPNEARVQNERDGMFVGRWDLYRIDVFTPSIEFAWEAERTRIRHRVGEREAWFLSAETIAVFKLLFFRTKDLADLERLVALREELDVAWVRSRIVSMMGESDERVTTWDRIVGATRPSS
jgi:hypothetical protein